MKIETKQMWPITGPKYLSPWKVFLWVAWAIGLGPLAPLRKWASMDVHLTLSTC